jgi:hypothetical protein
MRIPFEILAPYIREHFYLDPGSGSFLIQLLLAALIGSAFAIKVYWKKVKAFFTGKKSEESAAIVDPAESDTIVADPSLDAPDGEKPNDQP